MIDIRLFVNRIDWSIISVDQNELIVIVVTGPVGSGKSTTAWALHDMLADSRIPTALIDMDYLRCAWPQVTEWNHKLGYDNFSAIAVNHQAIGVRCFVMADVVESLEQRSEYEQAVPGAKVVIVRLDVPMDVIESRLHGRETPESVDWYLARAPELQEILTRNGIGDLVVEVRGHSPAEVAKEIFDRLELGNRKRM